MRFLVETRQSDGLIHERWVVDHEHAISYLKELGNLLQWANLYPEKGFTTANVASESWAYSHTLGLCDVTRRNK